MMPRHARPYCDVKVKSRLIILQCMNQQLTQSGGPLRPKQCGSYQIEPDIGGRRHRGASCRRSAVHLSLVTGRTFRSWSALRTDAPSEIARAVGFFRLGSLANREVLAIKRERLRAKRAEKEKR
jgi:hypothetical protein